MKIQKKNNTSFHSTLVILFLSLSNILFTSAQEMNYPVKKVNGVDCYVYIVQQAEGFYRIGKNFDTTEEIIRKFNPQITDGLKVGMELYIPVKEKPSQPDVPYTEHVVQRKQTVFRIRKIYNITEEELLQLNPQIKNDAIREGDILRIPVKKEEKKTAQPVQTPVRKPDTISARISSGKEKIREYLTFNQSQDTLKIAFLLPFMLDQKPDISDSRFIEFYAGALVAVRDAQKKGQNFSIHTFDTEKSDLRLMEILQNDTLKAMDLIVGPAYSGQISVIGDFARMHNIKTLIPFSSKILDIGFNPYIYQFNPGQDIEINKILKMLKSVKNESNIIFAEIPSAGVNDESFMLSNYLKTLLTQNHIEYQNIYFGSNYLSNLQSAMHKNRDNIIFFNSSKLSQISPFFKDLIALSENNRLKIYEPYSWRGTDKEKPKSFYLSVFQEEYNSIEYENYERAFLSLYDWVPFNESPRYDLLGYDLMNYFLKFVLNNETMQEKSYPLFQGVQSTLEFKKTSERGGYVNQQLNPYE